MSEWVDVEALAKVVVVSLVLGAGIPALFALGVRAFATGDGARPVLRTVAGYACMVLVAAAIVLGIATLAAGE